MKSMSKSFDLYLEYFLISRNYALEIEMLDVYFSEWIKYLNESNIIDNTLICIASDHGDLLGFYNLYGKSRPYTASIQVPLICMNKYGIRPNTNIVNKPVALMDLFGTFLDYATSGIAHRYDINDMYKSVNTYNYTNMYVYNYIVGLHYNLMCSRYLIYVLWKQKSCKKHICWLALIDWCKTVPITRLYAYFICI